MSVSSYSIAQFINFALKIRNRKFNPTSVCDEEAGLVAVHTLLRVPTSSGNHDQPGKIINKSSMHGKIMEFEKNLNNHGIL